MSAAEGEVKPDSFLTIHIVRRAGEKAAEFSAAKMPGEFAKSSYGFAYHDDDLEGDVFVFQRPGASYTGDAKTNYEELHNAAVQHIERHPPPNTREELARFETYGENRPLPLTSETAPFPLTPETPYHTHDDFYLYEGEKRSEAGAPTLYRYLATSPDGKEYQTGAALSAFLRDLPRYYLNPFLAYQAQVAKVRLLTRDFRQSQKPIRNYWKWVSATLDLSPPRFTELDTLAGQQDQLVNDKAALQRQLNTLSVAEYHLRRLQPAAFDEKTQETPHLFSEELRRVTSLRAAIQTELDYIEPLLERVAHIIQRLSLREQKTSNKIAQAAKDTQDIQAKQREYFAAFIASVTIVWATVQSTEEFAKDWWRWPLVWGLGVVVFSGAILAHHYSKPRRRRLAFALLVGTAALAFKACTDALAQGYTLPEWATVFASPYFWAVAGTATWFSVTSLYASIKGRLAARRRGAAPVEGDPNTIPSRTGDDNVSGTSGGAGGQTNSEKSITVTGASADQRQNGANGNGAGATWAGAATTENKAPLKQSAGAGTGKG